MPRLVALDIAAGPEFVLALGRVWDQGDVAVPVDPRLPTPARLQLFRALAPDEILRADGYRDPISLAHADLAPLREGDALVVPTSGSTGEPKGVVLTHAALTAHARAVHGALGIDRTTDRWLACLPLTHVGGLGVIVRSLIDEVPLEVLPGFDLRAVADAASRGATVTSLVTTTLDRVHPEWFRWIVLGGSADATMRPPNVVHTYGLTESAGGVVYDGTPLTGVEVRVDARGIISLRSPTLLRAYRNGTDPKAPDGWLATGDLGRIDLDGQLEVHGRAGELIISGGENVWPAAVEAALTGAPGVADVAVGSRPDAEWGQRVVAYVVPVDAGDPPELDALRGWAKDQIAGYAAPRELVLVERIERTSLGKIRRDALH